ncbi:RluA family pseudouridine synthase [Chondromyces apiculatus]|uniref:Pseudouridine synthase n=1 Tax=Chondromyces apiculatus DSM 436 TaxID=1192034 RepID=A0A017SW72_9BACT|nr:RluA family pseudouridine synthase [Chondromyces apiculatus]EYF00865.1 Ribosomal large subunit pseudouridine synthase D [Chondromyces apiculatus DSM 436]
MTRISARQLEASSGTFGRGIQVVRPPEVPEGAVVTVLRVPPEAAGMRLDRFVQTQLRRTSRTRAAAIVALGAYAPDARRLRGSDRVRAEQCILLWREPWDEQAPDVEIPVLYEDEHLVAINKPPLIPVHPTARYHKSTVVKLLEAARQGEHLYLAHRLDRETSGVLLLSRTSEADRHIKAQFEGRATVTKRYLAITWGWPERDQFRVEVPLELDPTNKMKLKMRVARPGTGLTAATAFETLERRVHPESRRRYSLVRCSLETGRQHQIRVHMRSLDLPLVGDKLYGPDEGLFTRGADGVLTEDDRRVLEIERHALHAAFLEFDHPVRGGRVSIESELPPDLRAFWDRLMPA